MDVKYMLSCQSLLIIVNSWDCCELIKDVYYVKTNEFRGKKYYAKAQLEFILTGKRKLKRYFKDIEFVM